MGGRVGGGLHYCGRGGSERALVAKRGRGQVRKSGEGELEREGEEKERMR